jgi:hypothetical protein
MCVFVHSDKTDTVTNEKRRRQLRHLNDRHKGVKMGGVRLILASVFVMVMMQTAGCVQAPSRVSSEVDVCCEADFFRYETYQVSLINAPVFLEPYLRQGLALVLAEKGLEPTLDRPDLMVNLIFNQVFLSPDAIEEDYFGDSVDPSASNRFMAAVSVAVIATDSEQMVWSGRLSRIHHSSHGQPRGNDHKMQGIIDGFTTLFADYPVRFTDPNSEL